MRQRVRGTRSGEHGAILVHAAFAVLALTVLTTFVADFGAVWLSRVQIQNAADAGAMAGAVALTYDSAAVAHQHAQALTQQNFVFGQAPAVDVTTGDGACPPGLQFPDHCVEVEAFRDQAHGNPLPLFFGGLVGLSPPGIRAVAVAQARPASVTNCLRPWAIVDQWIEFGGPFQPTSTFDRYKPSGSEPDTYAAPSTTAPGTGAAVPTHYGRRIAVRIDTNLDQMDLPGGPMLGWVRVLRLPPTGTVYDVTQCAGVPMTYGSPAGSPCPTSVSGNESFWAARGCYGWWDGGFVPQTQAGIGTLVSADSAAFWDPSLYGGLGGVAGSCCSPSPRIVPVGIVDLNDLLTKNPQGYAVVRLANIIGMFIEGMGSVNPATGVITCCPGGDAVVGRIVRAPGQVDPTVPVIDEQAAFLRAVLLVR